jgi:hypothetical protein
MNIELINPDQLRLVLDQERTRIAGKEIYERITRGFAFKVDGVIYRIDNHGYTDLGSIPRLLQVIPYLEHWRYPCSYCTHDSGYELKGFWINGEFKLLSRSVIDKILKNMVLVEGIYQNNPVPAKVASPVIYSGVRAGGWYNWNYRKMIEGNSERMAA